MSYINEYVDPNAWVTAFAAMIPVAAASTQGVASIRAKKADFEKEEQKYRDLENKALLASATSMGTLIAALSDPTTKYNAWQILFRTIVGATSGIILVKIYNVIKSSFSKRVIDTGQKNEITKALLKKTNDLLLKSNYSSSPNKDKEINKLIELRSNLEKDLHIKTESYIDDDSFIYCYKNNYNSFNEDYKALAISSVPATLLLIRAIKFYIDARKTDNKYDRDKFINNGNKMALMALNTLGLSYIALNNSTDLSNKIIKLLVILTGAVFTSAIIVTSIFNLVKTKILPDDKQSPAIKAKLLNTLLNKCNELLSHPNNVSREEINKLMQIKSELESSLNELQ